MKFIFYSKVWQWGNKSLLRKTILVYGKLFRKVGWHFQNKCGFSKSKNISVHGKQFLGIRALQVRKSKIKFATEYAHQPEHNPRFQWAPSLTYYPLLHFLANNLLMLYFGQHWFAFSFFEAGNQTCFYQRSGDTKQKLSGYIEWRLSSGGRTRKSNTRNQRSLR